MVYQVFCLICAPGPHDSMTPHDTAECRGSNPCPVKKNFLSSVLNLWCDITNCILCLETVKNSIWRPFTCTDGSCQQSWCCSRSGIVWSYQKELEKLPLFVIIIIVTILNITINTNNLLISAYTFTVSVRWEWLCRALPGYHLACPLGKDDASGFGKKPKAQWWLLVKHRDLLARTRKEAVRLLSKSFAWCLSCSSNWCKLSCVYFITACRTEQKCWDNPCSPSGLVYKVCRSSVWRSLCLFMYLLSSTNRADL